MSNDPVSTSTIVHTACANRARTGTAVRGDTRARAGKNTPSVALADGTRAPTSGAHTSARRIDPAKAPFLRQVYGDTIGEMPTYRAYKDALDKTEALEHELEELGKAGKPKESKEARERDPILTKLIGPITGAKKAIAALRAQEKAIRDSQLTDEQKEDRLLAIRKRQTEVQRQALERWDDAHRTRS